VNVFARSLLSAGLALTTVVAGTSTSASSTVQVFPPPGSCHVRGQGLYVLPDPRCTPGAADPRVTQANTGSTICRAGYTRTVRPSETITEPEKREAIAAYGDYAGARPKTYELDHLIPLELGGAPNSARNLWPERDYPNVSGNSYYLNPKDHVEHRLRQAVCAGKLELRTAQREIATNWN
jgi:hypothetical protein